jgi:hypothetical protein
MEQAQKLLSGHQQDAEHEMGVHLGSAEQSPMAPTVVVLQ